LVFGITTINREQKRAQQLLAQSQDQRQTLQKLGIYFDVGIESAASQDQLEEAINYIMSPLTSLPDKIEMVQKTILYNMRKGHGAVNQFWNFVFNNWMQLYGVWVVYLGLAEQYDVHKVRVEYTEVSTMQNGQEKAEGRSSVVDASTVAYMLANPRFRGVSIKEIVRREPNETGFRNPNADMEAYRRGAYHFGREVVLLYGWRVLNYLNHPDHVLPKTVLVIQTGGPQQQSFGQGVAGAADFTGGKAPPSNRSIPAKING
jgi:hypothetical protein